MNLRNATHDRPAEAAAAFLVTCSPLKALAQARDLLLGQSRAAVFDDQHGLPFLHCGADIDARTDGAVANGVVDEVAQHDAQQHLVAVDDASAGRFQTQVLLLAQGLWRQIANDLTCQRIQVHGLHRYSRSGLQARQREQLINQTSRAVATFERRAQRMLAPRVVARMLQDLALHQREKVLEIGAGAGYMARRKKDDEDEEEAA